MRIIVVWIISLVFFCSIPLGITDTIVIHKSITEEQEQASFDAYRERMTQRRSQIYIQLQKEHELELEMLKIEVLGKLQQLGASKTYVSARGFGGSVTTGNTTNTNTSTNTTTSSVGNITNR